MEDLQKKISNIKASGGGGKFSDWVGGYEIAVKEMDWRKGIKLIIHIADVGGHGNEFSEKDKHHPKQGQLLPPLIQE